MGPDCTHMVSTGRYSHHSDEESLMAAYALGDSQAFQQLYGILGPKIHGFFLRNFRDRDQADDLLQTTFLKLHQARKDYQPGRPVRPWIFTIASRVRFDELRRKRRTPRMVDLDTELLEVPAQSQRLELAWSLQSALNTLSPAMRAIVVLHRFGGLTFGEIAALIGSTEGAVRLRSFRALRRMRERLAPEW